MNDWFKLRQYCHERNIDFLASVFQEEGVNYLRELQPQYYKVASRAAKTYPYDMVPGPFLVSTGLGLPEVTYTGTNFLDCAFGYPAPPTKWCGLSSGLSDHSGTVYPGLDAIARGADFLEVHFCAEGLDPGNDGPVCLNFDQLKLLCDFNKAEKEMA